MLRLMFVRPIWWFLVGFVVAASVQWSGYAWSWADLERACFSAASFFAGLCVAGVYVAGLSIIMTVATLLMARQGFLWDYLTKMTGDQRAFAATVLNLMLAVPGIIIFCLLCYVAAISNVVGPAFSAPDGQISLLMIVPYVVEQIADAVSVDALTVFHLHPVRLEANSLGCCVMVWMFRVYFTVIVVGALGERVKYQFLGTTPQPPADR